MRILTALLCLLFIASSCYGAPLGKVDLIFDEEAVATQNTITSAIFPVKSGGFFGAWYKATTPAPGQGLHTPSVNVTIEMSYTPTSSTFVEPDDFDDLETNLTNTNTHIKSVNPPPMAYMRFKAAGLTANTTGTTITLYMFSQE